jgi:hypothetical protein
MLWDAATDEVSSMYRKEPPRASDGMIVIYVRDEA